jgi:hypothetical protein
MTLFYRRYKLISDANNVNPFPGSFLDYVCSIRLHPVTTNKTVSFVKIQCRFRTENEMSGLMKAELERIHTQRLQTLEQETKSVKVKSKAGVIEVTMLIPMSPDQSLL